MSKNSSIGGGNNICTVGGRSTKLSSQFVGIFGIGKFAAGNIYIGHYIEAYTSPMETHMRFGHEFTSRPTQLEEWYKYTRGTSIDHGDHDVEELKNSGGDEYAIYAALTNNKGSVGDNGVKTTYKINDNREGNPTHYAADLSETNESTIAYGSITDEKSKGSFDKGGDVIQGQSTIDLQYRDLIRKPKYITVVASVGKYGDSFTSNESNVMLVNSFELVHGTPVTASQSITNEKNSYVSTSSLSGTGPGKEEV